MINIFGLLLLCVAVVTAAPAAGTKAAPTIASIYAKCANPTSSRFCVGTTAANDADCIDTSGGCDVLVAYERTSEGKHNFDLITKEKTGYAVLAFSDDNQDGDDSMIVCQKNIIGLVSKDKAEGSVLAIVKLDDEDGLTFAYNGVSEEHIICSLTVENAVTYNQKVVNLDGSTEYFLFAASGPLANYKPETPSSTAKSPTPNFRIKEIEPFYNKCKTTGTVCVGETTAAPTTDCTTTSGTCDVLLVYQPTTTKAGAVVHNFDLLTKQASAAYAALSFSLDGAIKGGPAVVCQTTTNAATDVKGSKFQVNADGTNFDAVTDETGLDVKVKDVIEDHVVCSFTLADTVVFNNGLTLSLVGDTSYYMFASYGTVTDANGALSPIVDFVNSTDSYFKTSEIDAIYAKCADTNKYVCVGTSADNTDNTSTCVAASNCQVLTVYEYSETDGKHIFDLITPDSNGYAAVAFSDNDKMDADGGLLCQKTTDNKVAVKKIKLIKDNIEILSDTAGVKTDAANNVSSHIICKFTLEGNVDYDDVTISLLGLKQYYIFGAYGPVNGDGVPQKHTGYVVSQDKKFQNLDRYTKTLYTGCNVAGKEDVICVGISGTTKADCLSTTDCQVFTRYEYTADGKHSVNLLTTVPDRYAAVSFSADDKRDDDVGVVCRKANTRANTVKPVKAIIGATAIEEVTDTSGLIQIGAEENTDKGVICSFELSKFVSFKTDKNMTLAGDKSYYLRAEYGTVAGDGKPNELEVETATTDAKFHRDESEIPVNLYKACEEEKEKVECVGGYLKEDGRTDDCLKTKDCAFLAVYRIPDSGEEPRFQLIADRPSQYIAIGFSEDDKMGDDKLVECIPSNTENPLQKAATGTGDNIQVVTLDDTKSELTKNNITDDYKSFIYCDFSMERDNEYKNKTIVLARTSEYNLLVAVGPLDDGKVGYHIGAVASQKKMFKSSAPSFMAASVFSYIILTFITALFK